MDPMTARSFGRGSGAVPARLGRPRSLTVDEQVGKLFDQLDRRGILNNTWMILLADHGESFEEHAGVYLHGSSLYQSELHVPLVVIPPPGTRVRPVVTETVSLRNIAATIADLAGLGTESPFPGRSLARVWAPSPTPPIDDESAERALAELVPNETLGSPPPVASRRPSPLAALTKNGWSYIRHEGDRHEELYHLRDDPKEQNNVAATAGARPRLERMRQAVSRMTRGRLTTERFNP